MTAEAQIRRFPNERDVFSLRGYVDEQEHRTGEPVLLALYYQPDVTNDDLYIFEIVDQYGFQEVGPEEDLFYVEYGYLPGDSPASARHLHLTLTNPVEYPVAIKNRWPKMAEVQEAVDRGQYDELRKTDDGAKLLLELNGRS